MNKSKIVGNLIYVENPDADWQKEASGKRNNVVVNGIVPENVSVVVVTNAETQFCLEREISDTTEINGVMTIISWQEKCLTW